MSTGTDLEAMLTRIRAFHDKHDFRNSGGEDLAYRVALMAEELGEIAACVTKGRPHAELAEEVADLFILLLGTADAAEIDIVRAFDAKMTVIEGREARMINGRIRVSKFADKAGPT